MPRPAPKDDEFAIHVDPSCLSAPADNDATIPRQDCPEANDMDEPRDATRAETMTEEQTQDTAMADEEMTVEQMLQETVDELQSQQHAISAALREGHESDGDVGEETIEDSVLSRASNTDAEQHDDEREHDGESRRSSSNSDSGRRVSGRTDALIHAAARAVVDQIERHQRDEPLGRESVLSSAVNDRSYTDAEHTDLEHTDLEHTDGEASYITDADGDRRESYMSESQHSASRRESEVFSHHSDAADHETHETDNEEHEESYMAESHAAAPSRRESQIMSDYQQEATDVEEQEDRYTDRGGDSSSHHDADSEVFSDRSHSARSSMGSSSYGDRASRHDYEGAPKEQHDILDKEDTPTQSIEHDQDETPSKRSIRSPRMSDMSEISQFSHYEREEFVPTIRGNRYPFRTPSDVRALQMSSPPPSVFSGSPPRSSKRPHPPTVSRLGSPMVGGANNNNNNNSPQYSPKNRTTPSRLKPRKVTPPLVLLHATILPLRWPWGDVLEAAPTSPSTSGPAPLSTEAKALRETWRFLHDRLGDTVCERGVLLPHPQGDYEVLEERLLEALELPLRRRARILECGHYLGPSNEMMFAEDEDEGDGFEQDPEGTFSPRGSMASSLRQSTASATQTHWCNVCRHEIKFESLGPGRVFRVKVYASNGLMKAGAWAACWKEMERVDVEIEPIVEAGVQDELERLADALAREAEEEEMARAADAAADFDEHIGGEDPGDETQMEEDEARYNSQARLPMPSSSTPDIAVSQPASPGSEELDSTISRHDQEEERRVRDKARLREIYGESPPPPSGLASPESEFGTAPRSQTQTHPEADSADGRAVTDSSYFARPSPVSPSEEAHARREARRNSGSGSSSGNGDGSAKRATLQSATLPELLLEATRVLLQDRKNVALVLLSMLVLFLAVKPPSPVAAGQGLSEWESAVIGRGIHADEDAERVVPDIPEAHVPAESAGKAEAVDASASEKAASGAEAAEGGAEDPCQSGSGSAAADAGSGRGPEADVAAAHLQDQQEGVAPIYETETLTSREVVRVVETVTQTETVKAFSTDSAVPSAEDEVEGASRDQAEVGVDAEAQAEVEVDSAVQADVEAETLEAEDGSKHQPQMVHGDMDDPTDEEVAALSIDLSQEEIKQEL